jgi:hypothetical protein
LLCVQQYWEMLCCLCTAALALADGGWVYKSGDAPSARGTEGARRAVRPMRDGAVDDVFLAALISRAVRRRSYVCVAIVGYVLKNDLMANEKSGLCRTAQTR